MTDIKVQTNGSITFTLHLIYLLSYLHFVRVRKEDGLLYTVYKLLEITISKKKPPNTINWEGKKYFSPNLLETEIVLPNTAKLWKKILHAAVAIIWCIGS